MPHLRGNKATHGKVRPLARPRCCASHGPSTTCPGRRDPSQQQGRAATRLPQDHHTPGTEARAETARAPCEGPTTARCNDASPDATSTPPTPADARPGSQPHRASVPNSSRATSRHEATTPHCSVIAYHHNPKAPKPDTTPPAPAQNLNLRQPTLAEIINRARSKKQQHRTSDNVPAASTVPTPLAPPQPAPSTSTPAAPASRAAVQPCPADSTPHRPTASAPPRTNADSPVNLVLGPGH
jgi:hypothetical protein